MKRKFFFAFLCGMLAAASLLTTSCGDDDDDEVAAPANTTDSTSTPTNRPVVASDLEGTWTSVECNVEGGVVDDGELDPTAVPDLDGLMNASMNKFIKDALTLTFKGDSITAVVKEITKADLKEMMKEALSAYGIGDEMDAMLDEAVAEMDMSDVYGEDFDFSSDATFEIKDNKIVVSSKNEDGEVETEEMPFELKDGKLYITSEEDGVKTTIVFEKK